MYLLLSFLIQKVLNLNETILIRMLLINRDQYHTIIINTCTKEGVDRSMEGRWEGRIGGWMDGWMGSG